MVAKVRFWLLESSRLIAKASFLVMILKSLFFVFSFLLRNVSFRVIMSISFSFRYNSSSLRFGLIP